MTGNGPILVVEEVYQGKHTQVFEAVNSLDYNKFSTVEFWVKIFD